MPKLPNRPSTDRPHMRSWKLFGRWTLVTDISSNGKWVLDGQEVTILGKLPDDIRCDFYIIGFDNPHPQTGHLAILMIESCLDKLSNIPRSSNNQHEIDQNLIDQMMPVIHR